MSLPKRSGKKPVLNKSHRLVTHYKTQNKPSQDYYNTSNKSSNKYIISNKNRY